MFGKILPRNRQREFYRFFNIALDVHTAHTIYRANMPDGKSAVIFIKVQIKF